ncbi:MAG: exo-beta-N-acetylmuramidase NamZ domain-containing protein, partial [Bacteroidota bacterium]
GLNVKKIFAPEHGFRGNADAGEKISDSKDAKTGLPIISIYGSNKAPDKADLEGIDLLIFDIQEVGTRFYTYISTLHYVMLSCADNKIPLMVFDRPNPNGHFVDGPILDIAYQSFVGMHPIPIVHGLTIGEYASMINGENWLGMNKKCSLQVISCFNYNHSMVYNLPIPPSPNLPNMRSIYLYPSICFFEGTPISLGRGTNKQFQVLGAPNMNAGDFSFTPVSKPGAMNPPQLGKLCRGIDLSSMDERTIKARKTIDLSYLIQFYKDYPEKESFFLAGLFFDKLAGNAKLREMIQAGYTEQQIKDTWVPGLNAYKQTRKKYLIYED